MTQEIARGPSEGSIPLAAGIGGAMQIPIWGSSGYAIRLRPYYPGTTSSFLFIQGPRRNRFLRLDYGHNIASGSIDYHWNQRGSSAQFGGTTNHMTIPRSQGHVAWVTARTLRVAGRPLILVAAALDAISIVRASDPLRRATEVAAGWAGAAAGCRVAGGVAGRVGMLSGNPLVAAGAGIGGCLVGAFVGYWAAERAASAVYGWVQGTRFLQGETIAEQCISTATVDIPGERTPPSYMPDDFYFP